MHKPLALLLAGLSLAAPAWADLNYYDLNQGKSIKDLTEAGKALFGNDLPISNPVYWNSTYQTATTQGESWISLGGSYASGTWGYSVHVSSLDSSGWTDGLRNNPTGGANLLGDTHFVSIANFHLDQASLINIALTDDLVGQGYGLNPSFSLYRGSVVYQTHDDVAVDRMNPKSGITKIQSVVDNGSVVDSQGIVSPYRNTLTNTGRYTGQFDALGGWSAGNTAGNWSAVEYITSVTGYFNPNGEWGGNANANSLNGYLLEAGNYIVVFGGNAQAASYAAARSATDTSPFDVVTDIGATLSFSAAVAPVPEPETWAMLLAGLGLVGAAARRRA